MMIIMMIMMMMMMMMMMMHQLIKFGLQTVQWFKILYIIYISSRQSLDTQIQ